MMMIGSLTIGEFIKDIREQRKLTQQDLATGIFTDHSYISKLERGKYNPPYKKVVLLMERLGFSAESINASYHREVHEIDKKIQEEKFDEIKERVTRLEKDDDFMSMLFNRQAIDYFKVVLAMQNKENPSNIRAMIMRGLKMTLSDFEEKKVAQYLLTTNDIKLIDCLAILYWKMGQVDDAIRLMYDLIANFDIHCIDERNRARILPWMYLNLTTYLYNAGRYEEELPLLKEGINICRKYNSMFCLPHLIGNMAWCKFRLGHKKDSLKLFYQAYYMRDAHALEEPRKRVRNFVLENFGMDLDTLHESAYYV